MRNVGFVKDLQKYYTYLDNPERKNIQIAAFIINLYTYSDDGILYVKTPTRGVMAANSPNHKVARNTRKRIVYTQNLLLHKSISRADEELLLKFENWGFNSNIKDRDVLMEKWCTTNKLNYNQP